MPRKQTDQKTFSERVVEMVHTIPKGRVSTYGRIARAAGGGAMAAQSITNILAKAYNNGDTTIPFHRIVYADGRIWINESYEKKRRALYKKEGIELDVDNKIKNFSDILYDFT